MSTLQGALDFGIRVSAPLPGVRPCPPPAAPTLHRLQVDTDLARFIDTEVLPGTGVGSRCAFWAGFSKIAHELAPMNRALLAERDRLQAELDAWHEAHPGPITDMPAYRGLPEAASATSSSRPRRCRPPRPTSMPSWRCRPARSWSYPS